MNSLQKDFLQRAVAELENLAKRAKDAVLTPEFLREAFRTLHTIKGNSQVFGFESAAKIAHELENLLSETNDRVPELKSLLLEGFNCLIDSFGENFSNQAAFFKKTSRQTDSSENFEEHINGNAEFFMRFSEHEKKSCISQVKKGKNIFFINADFDFGNFAGEFKDLREKLTEKGEIIATFPNPNSAEKGKIGFQVCFASNKSAEDLSKITKTYEIIHQKQFIKNDLDDILSQVAAHGRNLAKKLSKDIKINVFAENLELSKDELKLIFDISLHLLRNAIDHAAETKAERKAKGKKQKAKIEILLEKAENGWELSVKDDGKGIDAESVRAKAIEKKLISPEKILTEDEMIDLIFLHEFSTAETVTEVSGRGVGLDAVKKMVENAGGTISVKSRRNFGTTFEVLLQYEK